jgi:hypothetical protein
MVGNLVVHSLDWLAHTYYQAARNHWVKTWLFIGCVVAFGLFIWARTELNGDFTVRPLASKFNRSDVLNRYVQATGNLLPDGAYDVKTSFLVLFWRNVRFIPLAIKDSSQSLLVLDEGLSQDAQQVMPVTLVGKIISGQDDYPDYYLKVMDPPSVPLLNALAWAALILIGGILVVVMIHSRVQGVDYAIGIPFGPSGLSKGAQPVVLWFGSLGAGYGDVILRQVPVGLKAIPAEARLAPVHYPDSWAVAVHQLRTVHPTTIATSYGALPAMRIEFEDERGLPRTGVVAATNKELLAQIIDVLHFVGQ